MQCNASQNCQRRHQLVSQPGRRTDTMTWSPRTSIKHSRFMALGRRPLFPYSQLADRLVTFSPGTATSPGRMNTSSKQSVDSMALNPTTTGRGGLQILIELQTLMALS
jgi:hypothetical protein